MSIPLQTTVGADTYRLDAVFVLSGAQGDVTLATNGDEPVLATILPAGSYSAFLRSFTLLKQDSTGAFNPVSATVVANPQPFTVFANSTTTVNFQFETDGTVVPIGSGNVGLTFGVTETAPQCTVLRPGCPDGYWCAPPALTGAPLACLPSGTTPIGAACASPLECVAPSTCHDFGGGPVCTALCMPDEFGQDCASGGTCIEADPTYGLCTAGACTPITGVNAGARTVHTSRFYLDFSNNIGTDPEELDVLEWKGSANYTSAAAPSDACSTGEDQYFGNSWTQAVFGAGGKVLVGAGSTGSWQTDGASSLLIHSTSTGCPHSAGIPVETSYRFREGIGADTIEVARKFSFGSTPFNSAFRPYVPRLVLNFDLVLHPNADGTKLRSESMYEAFHQTSDWDGSWFALTTVNGTSAGTGVIVLRKASPFSVNLMIDGDALTWTNASSTLLLPPNGGFTGDVNEEELLCFFDPTTWTAAQQASLTLPDGCALDLACDVDGSEPPADEHPHIDAVKIDPGTTITTCQTATLTASATDPAHRALGYGWAEYGNNRAPLVPNGNQAVFGPAPLAGDYFLEVWLQEPEGVFATFPVPTIHVTLDPACPPIVPDLTTISQLYCAGTCDWGGSQGYGCHQEDADNLCRLRTGNPNATAQSFRITTALPEPGFCCSPYPTGTNGCVNIGPQPGIAVDVDVVSWSLLDSHGPGDVVTDVVCQP